MAAGVRRNDPNKRSDDDWQSKPDKCAKLIATYERAENIANNG
jgi:hypothetical protein